MPTFDKEVQIALEHIRYLSQTIGGRGSCTPEERLAGEYAAGQMRRLGAQEICVESFTAIPSAYWAYALSFGAAILGNVLVWLLPGRPGLIAAALLHGLGVWGMLAETEVVDNWARRILPRKTSQNVSGCLPPAGETRRRAVLCAHVDTHRTPVFYSSKTWYALFNLLVSLAFLSLAAGALLFSAAAIFGWGWARWLALALLPVQIFSAAMCLQSEFTPYSPGANDNASGVGAILALAERLRQTPLAHTEVHLAFTGCEEVGDWGISAYLGQHAAALGPDVVYIILDEVGLGRLKYLSSDGLLVKHATHAHALALARQAKAALPKLEVIEGIGVAYTDALVATKRGLPALTLCTVPTGNAPASYWHQMSDRLETLNPNDLEGTIAYTWTLLQLIDKEA
jgi:hypothetical protein